jgi:competence ComEA-like helix-hairpin-helix protein
VSIDSDDAKKAEHGTDGATPSGDRGWAWVLFVLALVGTGWGWWGLMRNPARGVAELPARSAAMVLDVNTATVGELCALPGVGETLAERIIEHRTKRGGLRSVEQLLAVQGMGQRTFESLRPFVRCSEPSWVTKDAAGRSTQ